MTDATNFSRAKSCRLAETSRFAVQRAADHVVQGAVRDRHRRPSHRARFSSWTTLG